MRSEPALKAMNMRSACRSVHFCVPRGGICHGVVATGACALLCACKVSSYPPGAIVRVLKALCTRVGAHGARPGVVEGRAFYVPTACTYTRVGANLHFVTSVRIFLSFLSALFRVSPRQICEKFPSLSVNPAANGPINSGAMAISPKLGRRAAAMGLASPHGRHVYPDSIRARSCLEPLTTVLFSR